MLCTLILYESGGTYSLTSAPNDRFLRNFFMAGLFDSQSFCQKSAERKSPKKYFFSYFHFWWLTWDTNPRQLRHIHNNVWKFYGDHVLNKFFFGCIIDIQKKIKKERREHASLKADKQLNAFYALFSEYCWCSWPMCVKRQRWPAPRGNWCLRLIRIVMIMILILTDHN